MILFIYSIMLIIVDDYIDVEVGFDIEIDYKFDDEISIDEVIN